MIKNTFSLVLIAVSCLVQSAADADAVKGRTYAYFPLFGQNQVQVVDTTNNQTVVNIPTNARGPAIGYPTLDGKKIYILDATDFQISVLDTKTLTLARNIPAHGLPEAGSLSADGSRLYVAVIGRDLAGVTVIDTASDNELDFIALPLAMATQVSPDGKTLYVSTLQSELVAVDLSTKKVTHSVSTGIFPAQLEISNDGAKAYAVNLASNSVTVVDLVTFKHIKTITVGLLPLTARKNPSGSQLWVANVNGNSVSVIDIASDTVVRTIRTPHGVTTVGFTPDGKRVYFAEASGPHVLDLLNIVLQGVSTLASSVTAQVGLVLNYPGQVQVYSAATYQPIGQPFPVDEEVDGIIFVKAP